MILAGWDQALTVPVITAWERSGLTYVRASENLVVLQTAETWIMPSTEFYARPLRNLADKVYVISLPERSDRRMVLAKNWQNFGMEYEIVDGVRAGPSSIRWEEMKGMEAYGNVDYLRGDYILGAVGCKRSGVQALEKFIESGAETALICQDDCLWVEDAELLVRRGLADLLAPTFVVTNESYTGAASLPHLTPPPARRWIGSSFSIP